MLQHLEVISANQDQKVILENLIELYIHDFSEFVPLDVGEDGRFGYPGLSRYWREPGHHAFLARVEGKWAGFALVRRMANAPEAGEAWDMAEFFVLRRYRRQSAGTQFAEALWNQRPGNWKVRVRADNIGGLSFWETAIGAFTGCPAVSRQLVADGVRWYLFLFQSPVLS
jgi:predicted acetyltransferase